MLVMGGPFLMFGMINLTKADLDLLEGTQHGICSDQPASDDPQREAAPDQRNFSNLRTSSMCNTGNDRMDRET